MPTARAYGALVKRVLDRYTGERVKHAGVPVISVGNIAVGGTGKTPFVIALARLIAERFPSLGVADRIAVLSRGYGRKTRKLVVVQAETPWQEAGDEPLVIKQAVPHAAVLVHPERALSANWAVNRLNSKLILLDDGFQHRKLARDLDIVLLDSGDPLGNGRLLPAGPLRESVESLKRAALLVGIGRNSTLVRNIAEKFRKPVILAVPIVKWPEEIDNNRNCRIFVMTGIARPSRFMRDIREKSLNVVGFRVFRDHHRFRSRDLVKLMADARRARADFLLTTEKDRARLTGWAGTLPLLAAGVELRFESTQELLQHLEPLGLEGVEEVK